MWPQLIIFILLCIIIVLLIITLRQKRNERENGDPVQYRDMIGTSAWFYLHAVADNYPLYPSESDRNDFIDHIESFAKSYPCEDCRAHMKLYVLEHPLYLVTNRSQAVYWMFTFHNAVNERLGKRILKNEEYYSRFATHNPPVIKSSLTCTSCNHL